MVKKIRNQIKVVFWDLDDTLWKGTLAEGGQVELLENRAGIIRQLNQRGIVNSIVSKNDYETAKNVLEAMGLWEWFVFPNISFQPKGEMIKNALKNMNLREDNALFIDDNEFNLREAEFYNPKLNVLDAAACDALLEERLLLGKEDGELVRLRQYKQMEKRHSAKELSSSNEKFLAESHIRVGLLPYGEEYFERICELTERTNQLNFTKNRMSAEELRGMLQSKEYVTELVQAADDYGDYGIVGFYTLRGRELVHFVFSCRIMNMGIEQWVYSRLGFPELEAAGEVAVELNKEEIPDWIRLMEQRRSDENENVLENLTDENTVINIFAVGACDLYHPIAYFAMPNQKFTYECNVYKGEERGVNVGTEYIRSQFEMGEKEKAFCREHFYNYTGSSCFRSRIFAEKYDYLILSFHDDMIYHIYENKKNRNIRVVRSPQAKFGTTSVLSGDRKLEGEEERKWLEENFKEGEFISEERFYDNLIWIKEHAAPETKIVLVTGPELDYYRKNNPHCPEVRNQIKKLNRILFRLQEEEPGKFAVADINKCIRSQEDVTDFVFHLKAHTAYNLFVEIVWTMVRKLGSAKKPVLWNVLNGRQTVIFGNGAQARNAFYNLRLGGGVILSNMCISISRAGE